MNDRAAPSRHSRGSRLIRAKRSKPAHRDKPEYHDTPERCEHRTSGHARRRWLAPGLLLFATVLSACDIFAVDDVVAMEVAEMRLPCMGMAPQECMLVRTRSSDAFGFFHEGITGFTYVPGYRYVLRVSRHTIRNPPADGSSVEYRLIRIESQQPSPRAGLLEKAAQMEALWHATRPIAYSVLLERGCFCGPDARGPVRVDVTREDWTDAPGWYERVTARRYTSDDRAVASSIEHLFPGVQGLFSYLRYAVANDADEVLVEYDAERGFPRRVFVNWRTNVADDEIEYIVHAITPAS